MATDAPSATALNDIDLSRVQSAVIREQDPELSSPVPERATDKDTVQLVLSLPREVSLLFLLIPISSHKLIV